MRRARLYALAIATLLIANTALAQTSPDRKWNIEVHGGAAVPVNQSSGTGTLPPLATDIPFPTFGPTRVVSTWYLGEGASLLNQALRSIRQSAQVTPLDPIVIQRASELEQGPTVGFRVSRVLTGRFSAELAVDYGLGRQTFNADAVSGFEATRATFETALNVLLSSGARGSQSVKSIATVANGRSRQLTTTGSLLVSVGANGPLEPYVVLGASVIANRGVSPSATLNGSYEFTLALPPDIPVPLSRPSFHETDTVTVRTSVDNALGWIIGGGVKYALSSHVGVRVDARDLMSGSTTRTLINVRPENIAARSGSAFLFLGTTPSIYFATPPTTLGRSTLSGDPVSNVETFTGTGVEHRVDVSAGVFWRF